jgi:hypothetical protein
MRVRVPKVSSLRLHELMLAGAILLTLACTVTSHPSRWPHSVWSEDAVSAEAPALAIDQQALFAEQSIERPMVVERGGRRYVGGVAYQVVAAPAPVVYSALQDGQVIERVLPKTKQVRVLSRQGNVWHVELLQGNRWITVEYTVVFREAPVVASDPALRSVDFWLDPSFAHDIEDVWGFFSVRELDAKRSLVSTGALVDLGHGFARLFETRVQQLILSTARNIQRYFEAERVARADLDR